MASKSVIVFFAALSFVAASSLPKVAYAPIKDPTCPKVNPPSPLFKPHESDCNQYYICDSGYRIGLLCPPDLYFDDKRKICDEPHLVPCSHPSPLLAAPSLPKVAYAPIKDPRCPKINPGQTLFMPHEIDCNQYYVCDSGYRIGMMCPPDLYFDAKRKVCDESHLAQCGLPSPLLAAPSLPKVAYAPRKDSRCPPVNPPKTIFISHESDCNQYYVCDSGYIIGMFCPPDLYFDARGICDQPHLVQCSHPSPLLAAPSLPKVAYAPRIDPRCPKINPAQPLFMQHESDCNQYYVCDNGYSIGMMCPPDLYFDVKKRECNEPHLVQCSHPSPVLAAPAAPAGSYSMKMDARCPKKNGALPVFLPHETSCANYYVCDTGMAIEMHCPHHLLFNTRNNVCDEPEQVTCGRTLYAAAASGPDTKHGLRKLDSRCPSNNGFALTLFSHETECGLYYVCDWGYAIQMNCPPTQGFDDRIKGCTIDRPCH